ncbi:MAG: T9SS type A sorting domain-containing protein [Ignavibacteriaceae bacterium]|nr:T9SS type A sorting domain-containing protein [Ignavibacteriaceae bacterium]
MKKIFYLFFLIQITAFTQPAGFVKDTVVRNTQFNNRTFAAYDRNGNLHVSYTAQDGTNSATSEIIYALETPSGFITTNVTNNFVSDNYSTLSLENSGAVHIGFTGRDVSNLFQIKYTNNRSGSFFTPVYITEGGENKATPYSKIGPDSVMHFVYFTYTNVTDNAYYRKLDLRTNTLSPEQFLVSAETSGDFDASLDVDAQGKVHVVVKSGGVFGGALKYFNDRSGSLTETPNPVTFNISYPKIVVDHNDLVNIVYRNESEYRLYYISYNGSSFSTPLAITPPGQRPAGHQNITVDDSNRIYVPFQSSSSNSAKGFFLVHGKGTEFSDTIRIYDLTSEYVTRNSSVVAARLHGEVTYLYAPGAVRDGLVICDIFRVKGNLFGIIPVEFTAFSAAQSGNGILLNWTTATEKNNYGFDIERSPDGVSFSKTGFIPGNGTTLSPKNYSWTDSEPLAGKSFYRLKQTDYNGTFSYSNVIETDYTLPGSFNLSQNYPNPFNPETNITFTIPERSFVRAVVFDASGSEVAVLKNGEMNQGTHNIRFNGSDLSSGMYILRVTAGNYSSSVKMLLMK